MGAAWKVDAILTVITEATFKDRECCDGRELRRQADDNAPCLLARENIAGADDPDTRREVAMLTRRGFAAVASCAICGITDFVATEVSAEGAPPAATPGVTRKILSQMDGPVPGYVTLLVEATLEQGATVARHTHPGIESAYVLEGAFELPVQGQPTRAIKRGDAFQIPPETPHAGGKPVDAKSIILITYVVEKGKPLASPAA